MRQTGQSGATYTFTRTNTTTGTVVVTYTGAPLGVQVGDVVKLTFTSGNLNNALYNNQNYTVTTLGANAFIVNITGTGLPGFELWQLQFERASPSPPRCHHPRRSAVNFSWLYGSPNGVVILPNNPADNYSATWDGYLQPTTAGAYQFQLDADDKARVLLDTGSGLVQILEHDWDPPSHGRNLQAECGNHPRGTSHSGSALPHPRRAC